MPGAPGLAFLAFLLVFVPWMAVRSARRVKAAGIPGSRESVWLGTMLSLAVLFGLAWLVSRGWDDQPFAMPPLGLREWAAAAAALAACVGIRAIGRATRSAEERKKLLVFRIAPRTPREWALWKLTVLFAAVAEETAYRGVGMAILWHWLGNPWVPSLLLAAAFAMAHALQGWKSGLLVFAIALVMHALVIYTQTLVLAMAVHAVYDLVAGYWIGREAAALRQEESR
jgi:membrane protease YdiL (CAAX protease family)